MSKYLTHEEAKVVINHAKSNEENEWLYGWDFGRRYGRFCERERIIKLLENWDRELIWIETAIALIKGEIQ